MELQVLFELDELQEALSSSIRLISVIADGLSCYTNTLALSGESTQAYVDALYSAYDRLDALSMTFRSKLDAGLRGEGGSGGGSGAPGRENASLCALFPRSFGNSL